MLKSKEFYILKNIFKANYNIHLAIQNSTQDLENDTIADIISDILISVLKQNQAKDLQQIIDTYQCLDINQDIKNILDDCLPNINDLESNEECISKIADLSMQFDSFLENVEKDDPRIRSLIEKLKLGDKESTALNKKRSLER